MCLMKAVFNKEGERLFKYVTVKIFDAAGRRVNVLTVRAGKRKGFSELQIADVLLDVANQVEKLFPSLEFNCVKVGAAAFNYVVIGEKAAA
jgi:hypothetical protein